MSLAAIEPMAAKLVDRLPTPGSIGRRLLYEPKWDGFRAIAHIDQDGGGQPYLAPIEADGRGLSRHH